VRDAGAGEHVPLRRRYRALVADGQRDQHTGVRIARVVAIDVRQHALEALAYAFAERVDHMHRAPCLQVDKTLHGGTLPAGAHRTGRTDAALEQPGLVIETMRVHVAVRTLEPHPQLPAAARRQYRYG
jgi:hypothetical protein